MILKAWAGSFWRMHAGRASVSGQGTWTIQIARILSSLPSTGILSKRHDGLASTHAFVALTGNRHSNAMAGTIAF
jgi:hypothetical protein